MAVREHPSQKRFTPAAREVTVRTRPLLYRGRGSGSLKTLYDADHVDSRQGGRFRWLFSTCLAAAVGAIAIIVIIQGSSETIDGDDGLLPSLRQLSEGTQLTTQQAPVGREIGGLKWAVAKTDRLKLTTGALSTRYIIHEMQKQKRGGREYIHAKPYARIVARLAPVPTDVAQTIPPFNPFKLYASSAPATGSSDPDENAGSGLSRGDVAVQVVELLGGILPGEDGQELDTSEVTEMVERSSAGFEQDSGENGLPLDGNAADLVEADAASAGQRPAPATKVVSLANTTVIAKVRPEAEDTSDELEAGEVAVVAVGQTDTLVKILTRSGADAWQARAMMEAAQAIFPESALEPGQEVRVTLVPSLTEPGKKEPSRFSVFTDGHGHLVTVSRNAAGEFVASATPQFEQELSANSSDINGNQATSLYASLYHAGQVQSLAPEAIVQIMRIHAFETDFRRRLRPGDGVEMFFDMQSNSLAEGTPGELLFTSITSGGDTFRFYRYRAEDGTIDYYDEQGNNSRRFLMRKPVRGDDVRLTSGYGVRFHPLLNERKMHTGVDWAAASGTPIVASGNGTIEELGRKGQYGKYIRIRHANGYQTAYGHMRDFASSLSAGARVRQGQVIGFVGSTGLSSGPHLHFEVLVNSRFVDPMSIEVPRERKLTGSDFKEFQAERGRIEDLMRRAPVMTNSK